MFARCQILKERNNKLQIIVRGSGLYVRLNTKLFHCFWIDIFEKSKTKCYVQAHWIHLCSAM